MVVHSSKSSLLRGKSAATVPSQSSPFAERVIPVGQEHKTPQSWSMQVWLQPPFPLWQLLPRSHKDENKQINTIKLTCCLRYATWSVKHTSKQVTAKNKNNKNEGLYVPHVRGSSLLSEHWATPSHLCLGVRHVPSGQWMFIFPQEPNKTIRQIKHYP